MEGSLSERLVGCNATSLRQDVFPRDLLRSLEIVSKTHYILAFVQRTSPGKLLTGFEELYLRVSYSHHACQSMAAVWQPAFASKIDKSCSNSQHEKRL